MNLASTSNIETNPKTGSRCLIVYYDADQDDYNENIEAAINHHGFNRGEIEIICLPNSMKHMGISPPHTP
jgi:hypothetical protein